MTEEIASTTEAVATDVVIEPTTETTLLSAEAPEAAAEIEYTDFTYPEGTVVDETIQDAFKAAAKEAGLTQAQAQHLTDMGGLMRAKVMADHQAAQAQVYTDWAEQSRSDKEFGGAKMDENLAIASKAINAFATPELKALLDSTGIGNHPEMIRAFYRAGKAMSEDNLVPGGKGPAATSSLADRLYPQ
jgi:hypothetical protein